MAKKVILDTDIGSDIDDAVCLAYLLAQPDCNLLGITTVTGQPVERACLASAICRVAGRDIPIYPGVEQPLLIEQRQPQAGQASALGNWPHQTDFPRGEALTFLRETIRANPGEITLLAIGPMTNVGLLFAMDPELPSLLAELVLMCGVFLGDPQENRSEWNAKLDPHASAIVYRARAPRHRSIGLDVTMQVTMPADEVRQRFQAPLLRPVLDFAEVWFQHAERVVFHDPLAAATIFNPAICTFQAGTVTVDITHPERWGVTDWSAGGEAPPHEIAVDVNPQAFFDEYFRHFD